MHICQISFSQIGLVLIASLISSAALLTSVSAVTEVPSNTGAPLVSLVSPPATEQTAIKLSGRTANPTSEEWERREPGPSYPGAASPARAELWVYNVGQATLRPFLPDPSKATGAAMIIVPGGGFMELAIEREGYSVAEWLTQRGIAAFVLKYRLAPMPADPQQESREFVKRVQEMMQPTHATSGGTLVDNMPGELRVAVSAAQEDGLEAVRQVRTHAAKWGLSPDRIGMVGFSAGAMTILNVVRKADPASRPDLIAPIYGARPDSAAAPSTVPPAFIAVASDDPTSSGSLGIYNAWRAAGAMAELHVFETGGHGFGMLHQGKSSDQWAGLFDHWLSARGFETRKALPAH